MNCCNDNGECKDGHGCAAHRCCNNDCNQGRDCQVKESWDLIAEYAAVGMICAMGLLALMYGVTI